MITARTFIIAKQLNVGNKVSSYISVIAHKNNNNKKNRSELYLRSRKINS